MLPCDVSIEAVFVRSWHWGTFTFIGAYGTQHGSEEWRGLNQIPLDDIYDAWPHPCHHYYEERLGKRPDAAEIRKRFTRGDSYRVRNHRRDSRSFLGRVTKLSASGKSLDKGRTEITVQENGDEEGRLKSGTCHKAALPLCLSFEIHHSLFDILRFITLFDHYSP